MDVSSEPSAPADGSLVTRRRLRVAAALVVVVVAAVYLAGFRPARVHNVTTVITAVAPDGTTIGYGDEVTETLGTHDLRALTEWRDLEGEWHPVAADGSGPAPSCLLVGAEVRLGVVDLPSVGGRPGGEAVVWLECRSLPPRP